MAASGWQSLHRLVKCEGITAQDTTRTDRLADLLVYGELTVTVLIGHCALLLPRDGLSERARGL
jgi:hypothetical protein